MLFERLEEFDLLAYLFSQQTPWSLFSGEGPFSKYSTLEAPPLRRIRTDHDKEHEEWNQVQVHCSVSPFIPV